MKMPDRSVCLRFHLDTNLINAKQKLPFINRLEKWSDDGVVDLGMSETAQDEATAGGHPQRTKKTIGIIYTMTYADTPDERSRLQAIGQIVFPQGNLTPNQQRDVEIIFNARKYGYTLITNDGASKSQPRGILGSRDDLWRQFQIKVVTDQEAVAKVMDAIQRRDNLARRIAQSTSLQLPNWIGQDF